MRDRILWVFVLTALLTLAGSVCAEELSLRVWPDKLQVRPGEPVELQLTVTGLPEGQTAAVTCRVVHRLDHEAASFTGTTDAEGRAAFVFRPQEEFGYEVLATAAAGGQEAQAREVFACAQNPYLPAVDYGFADVHAQPDLLPDGLPHPGPDTRDPRVLQHIEHQIAKNRFLYRSVLEISAAYSPHWPVVPPTNLHFKGMHYYASASAWRTLCTRARENGMYTVTYVAVFLQSLGGSEFMRRYPQYLSYAPDGSLTGEISTVNTRAFRRFYDHYPESALTAFDTDFYRPGLRGVNPDTLNTFINSTDLEAVKLGVESFLEGKEFYGYDGVRYDGHYLVPGLGDPLAPVASVLDWQGNPQPSGAEGMALSARNMRYTFETARERYPDFMFGFNDASLRGDMSDDEVVDRELSRVIYPGSFVLDEVAKGGLYAAALENRWEDLIANQKVQADRARKLDAFLTSSWPPGPGQNEVDTRQIKAVGWALGLRWMSGQYHPSDEYFRLYNQFAMRFGEYLLSNNRERLSAEQAAEALEVSASRPVWWEEFAFQLRTDHGRYFTVSLVNAPLEERLTKDAEAPPPAEQVRVQVSSRVLGGGAPQAVWALNPDAPQQALQLTPVAGPDGVTVEVPSFPYWTVLVIPY